MIRVEAKSGGGGRTLLARGWWRETDTLPWWNAVIAMCRIERSALEQSPRDGVSIIIRREP